MELSVGQLTGRAPVQALYNICPVFKGVGVSQILLSLLVMAYMTRYLAWLMLYVFHLFWTVIDERPGLPWLHCKNFPELQNKPCREAGAIANFSHQAHTKLSAVHDESSLSQFMRTLENPKSSIAEFGEFQYYILAAQGLVWIVVFAAICFGVRWLGKVMYSTFLIPLSLLIVCFTRAFFLQGAWEMFERFYAVTNWEVLIDSNAHMVWKAAVEQAILATGIGFGAFITIGSYNKRSANLVRDSIAVLFGHACITALQVATIICFVGFISLRTGLDPKELISQGENQMWHILTYISYMPNLKVWTGIILFMSIFVLLNIFYLLSLNILASLEDALGEKWSRCFPRFCLALLVAIFGFGSSLYFATQAGKYAYELTSGYLKYITLWTILAFELLAISWFYCAHSLGKDLKSMLHNTCCWCLGHFLLYFTYLLPVIPIAIAVLNVMGYNYEEYREEIRNWPYSEYVGIAIAVVPLLPIPLFAFFTLCRNCSHGPGVTKAQRLRYSFRSPMRYEIIKNSGSGASSTRGLHRDHTASPRYISSAPGYVLLPQAPLAEPEPDNDMYNTSLIIDRAQRQQSQEKEA
uniref:Uncharacterized protein n=1 Tax=Acrobeloides nanus TaxID=290746 RepID=A0A914DUF0_9BILA